MDEDVDKPTKSRFAVPEAHLAGDSNAGHGELVTTQPTQPPNDWAPATGSDGDGGDGD